jgi:vitamin B12 transporter
LQPERSEGWDIGVEQVIGDGLVVSVTWFENDIEDLIVDPFGGPGFNRSGKGKANGLEVGVAGQAWDHTVRYGLAYTYLQRSLNDLPEHVLEARVRWLATSRLALGAGASYVGQRTLGGDPLDEYLLLRLHGSYEVSENLSLSLRVENLTDEDYSYISFGGSPEKGRGLGAFAGAVVTF